MSYITVDQLKDWAGGKFSNEHDALLSSYIIPTAEKAVNAYTRRETFEAAADDTRYFDSVWDVDDDAPLVLHVNGDIAQITSVVNGDGTTIPSNSYIPVPRRPPYYAIELLPSSGLYWTGKPNGDTANAIAVTGRWGYSITPPADIQVATMLIAKAIYDARVNPSQTGAPIVTMQGDVIAPSSAIPRPARELLDPYRRLL